MTKPGARTLVKTWVGFIILAIVIAVAGYLVVQYAPKADVSYVANAKCKPKKKKACFVMTVTDAKTGRPVSDAAVEATVNDTTTRKLLELGTMTDSAGVATLSLRMAKRAGGYTGSYVVKKTGYSNGVGSFRGAEINPDKKIVISKSITPNTTPPAPSVPPIGDGGDTTPEESCQPVSSPVSAAHACLAVKVVDEDREPVAGAWVSAPGYITLAETGNGLNGTVLGQTAFFPIRMTKASNGWIPVRFNITVSYQGKEVTIAQASTDSVLTAFIGKAEAATTKQVTITSPRDLIFQTIGDFPDDTDDGGDGDQAASCPAPASTNGPTVSLDKLLGIKKVLAQAAGGAICFKADTDGLRDVPYLRVKWGGPYATPEVCKQSKPDPFNRGEIRTDGNFRYIFQNLELPPVSAPASNIEQWYHYCFQVPEQIHTTSNRVYSCKASKVIDSAISRRLPFAVENIGEIKCEFK